MDLFTTRFIHKLASESPWTWHFQGEPIESSDLADPQCLAPIVLASALTVYNRCLLPKYAVSGGVFVESKDALLNITTAGVMPIPPSALLFCLNHAFEYELVPASPDLLHVDLARHLGAFSELNRTVLPTLRTKRLSGRDDVNPANL